MEQLRQLDNYLAKLAGGGLCIAFSGGVDSAVLLKAACTAGAAVHAVTMYTPFHSPLEPTHAARLAGECGAVHHIITLEEMPPRVLENPPDRCYLCKREIFSKIRDYAKGHGLAHVLDGTNADDLDEYRPGLRALEELQVKSPLADLGIAKSQVRKMARELGLSIAEKPSAPCLATRFPYDEAITPGQLWTVDGLETYLKSLGPLVVRARSHGDILRIEVRPADFPALLEHREELVARCKQAGYLYVTLDLEGFRSGSMDEKLHPKKPRPRDTDETPDRSAAC